MSNRMGEISSTEYREAVRLVAKKASFATLIAAALMSADSSDALALGDVFPGVRKSLGDRYGAPGGRIWSDKEE